MPRGPPLEGFLNRGRLMNATVSSRGQIALPRPIRHALGLKAGSTIAFTLEEGEVPLRPATAGTAGRLAGSLRRYASPARIRAIRAEVKRKVARAAAAEALSD